jgi:hypothetical protein
MVTLSAVGLMQVLLTGTPVQADAKGFEARWREAEGNVRAGPGQQYFNDVFFKEFFGKYTVHVDDCTQRTGQRVTSDLKAAVELGAAGGVLAVLVRPESPAAECFAELVRKNTFSRPPSDHFWIPVEVRFTKP